MHALLRYSTCALIIALSLPAQTLRDLAAQRGIRFGAAVDPTRFTETLYANTLAQQFSQVEPENVMKFGLIHTGPTTYNFGPPDAIVAFAKTNSMAVRGHTMVWYNQNPTWLTNGNFNPSQLSSILQDHIKTVMGRYAGQVYAWDVVNEAFNDDGTLRSTLWSNSPGIGLAGTAYIEQAFRWAHDADPNALLFYNDYSAETVNTKADAIFKMAQDFKARGVPIHGIGMQMHLTTNTGSLTSMETNIKRITDLGLQIQITEFDVRLPVDATGAATAANLATQAQIYHDILALCLKYPLCTAFQSWGFTDKYSWIPGTFAGFGAGLEFDAKYQAKPAQTSAMNALQTAPPVIANGALANAANYAANAVAPGEIVVLFGPSFGPANLAVASATASGIPSTLAATRLFFDGVAAPILYSEVGQVSAIVPFGVASKATTDVQYEYQGVRSNTVTVKVAPTVPGLFTLDNSGAGAAAALDAQYRVISPTNPAHRGDMILLYGTGGGVTNPSGADGSVTASAASLVAAKSVTIGGVDCPVSYAGSAPGLVTGAVQINVQVAAGVPSGPQPVVLTVGGVSSASGVTVLVQ